MARPIKQGLDYFTLDCHFDDKVELVIAEFGMTGLGILIRLFQKIYSENGYYCCWDDDVALLFSRNNGVGGNVVSEVINACLRRGVFDCEMYKRCSILTSKGIQKRYLEAATRRKSIEWKKDYLLISIPTENINVDNNAVNVSNNAVNDSNNSQIKVNKSKLNKTKVNKSKLDNSGSTAAREALMTEYSEQERTELYPGSVLTVAECDYLYRHIEEYEFNNYMNKLNRYPNCKQPFETILQWAISDGSYHD